MKSVKFKKLAWPDVKQTKAKVDDPDIADAKRAAMTCVCYAKTIGMINGDYPDVYTPDDLPGQNDINNEGWIFFPKDS